MIPAYQTASLTRVRGVTLLHPGMRMRYFHKNWTSRISSWTSVMETRYRDTLRTEFLPLLPSQRQSPEPEPDDTFLRDLIGCRLLIQPWTSSYSTSFIILPLSAIQRPSIRSLGGIIPEKYFRHFTCTLSILLQYLPYPQNARESLTVLGS